MAAAAMVVLCHLSAVNVVRPAPASAAHPPGGVVLDGWGGLTPFGGVTINKSGAPYWHGWDIARAVVVLPDGSGGWTLDGFGGIHNWGAAPRITIPAYWHGWDIARAVVVLPDRRSGYVLDGWGGITPFGSAPHLGGNPYWQGWDIARGFDVHFNSAGIPDGGWTLDAWGGVHAFGGAPHTLGGHYYAGYGYWQKLHVTGNGAGAYAVGRFGIVERHGNPSGISWWNYPYWGSWDIARDMVPVAPSGGWRDQPLKRAAASAMMVDLHHWARYRHGVHGLGENSLINYIMGSGASYNLASCGGFNQSIGDRTADMASRSYFAHEIWACAGPTYVWDTYYSAYGVGWTSAGENIARAEGSLPDSAWISMNRWLGSPTHHANVVSTRFGHVGCGVSPAGASYIWGCGFQG